MNEYASTSSEGSPQVEAAERQILGAANYQKIEVVHRFADENPWLHPLLIGGTVLVVLCVVAFFIKRRIANDS